MSLLLTPPPTVWLLARKNPCIIEAALILIQRPSQVHLIISFGRGDRTYSIKHRPCELALRRKLK